MQEFTAGQARAITGASQRQLDYWDDLGIIPASISRKNGKGKERRYSYIDLLKVRVVVELRRAGFSLQKIRKALAELRKWDPQSGSFATKKIVGHGTDILVTTSDRRVLKSLLKKGQYAFSVVMVGPIVQDTVKRIQPYLASETAVCKNAL